jgi:lycopene cyclase CruP
MFQKSMSVGIGERVNPNLIVDLLSNNFKSMNKLGDTTLKPFLQDVVQFVPLSKILLGVTLSAPLSIPPLLLHVGPVPLLMWMYHFTQVSFNASYCYKVLLHC